MCIKRKIVVVCRSPKLEQHWHFKLGIETVVLFIPSWKQVTGCRTITNIPRPTSAANCEGLTPTDFASQRGKRSLVIKVGGISNAKFTSQIVVR